MENIKDILTQDGVIGLKIARFDPCSVIITKDNDANLEQSKQDLNMEKLKNTFTEVLPWKEDIKPYILRIYEVFDIPLNLWNEENFRRVGEKLREVIEVHCSQAVFTSVKFCVLINDLKDLGKNKKGLKMKVNNKEFALVIYEIPPCKEQQYPTVFEEYDDIISKDINRVPLDQYTWDRSVEETLKEQNIKEEFQGSPMQEEVAENGDEEVQETQIEQISSLLEERIEGTGNQNNVDHIVENTIIVVPETQSIQHQIENDNEKDMIYSMTNADYNQGTNFSALHIDDINIDLQFSSPNFGRKSGEQNVVERVTEKKK